MLFVWCGCGCRFFFFLSRGGVGGGLPPAIPGKGGARISVGGGKIGPNCCCGPRRALEGTSEILRDQPEGEGVYSGALDSRESDVGRSVPGYEGAHEVQSRGRQSSAACESGKPFARRQSARRCWTG